MNITEFLEARIAEDEAVAREAEKWADDGPEPHLRWFGQGNDKLVNRLGKAGPHVARHDPARVLAEGAAKRAVIGLAKQASEVEQEFDDYEWQGRVERSEPLTGDAILSALAAVYRDHPGYRQEWKV